MVIITEIKESISSVSKIIWFISVSIFLLLFSLPFYEEHIKGEQILSDYIDQSKDINADVIFTENKVVTISFETYRPYTDSELLKIDDLDSQDREYSWGKNFSGYSVIGSYRVAVPTGNKDYFSFTPKVSGVHHIRIGNANFETDVTVFSGMRNPYQQPFFMVTLFISFIIVLTGLFSLRKKAIVELIYSGKIANEILYFCLAIPISLIIVYSVVGV